jgi:hypothetical protein
MREIITYFDRAYIINLADRADRRRQVERELRRVGLSVPSERVRLYSAVRPLDKGPFADIGTRGCFESHRNVLQLAVRDRLRNVLIFEDDVSFRDIGPDFGRQIITRLSEIDWDVVCFGYLAPADGNFAGPLVRWAHDIIGAHFYAVNGKFIPRMLEYMQACELRPRDHPLGGPMPADGAYNHVRYIDPRINLFIAAPNLAYQRSSRTDIARPRSVDQLVWLRPVIELARELKHRISMLLDRGRLHRQLKGSGRASPRSDA